MEHTSITMEEHTVAMEEVMLVGHIVAIAVVLGHIAIVQMEQIV